MCSSALRLLFVYARKYTGDYIFAIEIELLLSNVFSTGRLISRVDHRVTLWCRHRRKSCAMVTE